MVPNNSTQFEIRSQVISGNHWGGQRDGRTHTRQIKRRVSHNTSPLVWYHNIQIKFEFQCDQIIGSKVATVWRLKRCAAWRGMQIQGKQVFNMLHLGWTLSVKRNRNETKRNETKRNETEWNETKLNETKRNQTKRNETTLHFASFRFDRFRFVSFSSWTLGPSNLFIQH
jgi:hypothetical protein